MKPNIIRIAAAYIAFVIFAIVAVWRIIDLQFIRKPDTSIRSKTEDTREIPCTRGSIIASDGRYLAFSIPEYKLCMDCVQPHDTIFYPGIDSLAAALADLYGDKKAEEYRNLLTSQRLAGRKYTVINKNLITYQQMCDAQKFPIFKEGRRRGGLIIEKYEHREYPYDKLAFRTLGHIRSNEVMHVGIEGSCDSILRGTPGQQPIRLTEHYNWIEDIERERIDPIDGTDVQITIDIDVQEIAEKALLRQIRKSPELEAGTVILMDVKTGEIKAMVNLLRNKNGKFVEEYNYAIGRTGEPGSVFKLATLTMLLDEGKMKLEDEIRAVVSWQYGNGKPFIDEYLRNYSTISLLRGFEISSNNVFRMMAARYYGSNPGYFVDQLNEKLMVSRKWDFDIAGLGRAHIKHPDDKRSYWSAADLPQIAMGYTLELTPLHTVAFYNAVANGGVMVRPHLVRNYQKEGVILKEFGTEEVGRVCKPETARELHRALRAVVENGTGRNVFKDCKVAVAGKTGTARVVMPNGKYQDGYGRRRYQATFVGFFPYDNPRYSAIAVVYSNPTHGSYYGATWGGPIICEIADELYANSPEWGEPVPPTRSLPEMAPYMAMAENDTISGIPSVIGMTLRDGLSTLERKGYSVEAQGRGIIVKQRPEPGSAEETGKITVFLSDTYHLEEQNRLKAAAEAKSVAESGSLAAAGATGNEASGKDAKENEVPGNGAAGNKTAENKTTENKGTGDRTADNRTAYNRTGENRTAKHGEKVMIAAVPQNER